MTSTFIRLTCTILASFFVVFSSVANSQEDSDKTKIRLDLSWYHQFAYAGFYAAKEKGFYADIGVEVVFNEVPDDKHRVTRLLNNQADFGISGAQLLPNYHNGAPIKILANYFQQSPLALMVQPDIKRLSQLSGRRVFANETLLRNSAIGEMLHFNRVDFDSLDIVSEGDHRALFRDVKIDAMTVFTSNEPYKQNESGEAYRLFSPSQFGIPTFDITLFTLSEFAKNSPEKVTQFTKASNRGWKYAMENKAEIIQIIIDKYNTQNKTLKELEFEAEETENLVSRELYPIGYVSQAQLLMVSEKLLANKSISEIKPISNLLLSDNVLTDELLLLKKSLREVLTTEERKFLVENPSFNILFTNGIAPYFFSEKERVQGITKDYFTVMGELLDVNFDYVISPTLNKNIEYLHSGKVDILPNFVETTARKEHVLFTDPFDETYFALAVRQENADKYTNAETLKNSTVAIKEGDYQIDLLRTHFPSISIMTVTSDLEGMNAVVNGNAQAFLDDIATVSYLKNKYLLRDIHVQSLVNSTTLAVTPIPFAVSLKNVRLRNILNKAINIIPLQTLNSIKSKWLSIKDVGAGLSLTQEEKNYIKSNPVLRINQDVSFPPFAFVEDAKHTGFTIDLVKAIAELLNMEIEFVSGSWEHQLKMLKNGQLDMLMDISNTEERKKDFLFSQPYLVANLVAVINKDSPRMEPDVTGFYDKKLSVVNDYAITDFIRARHPAVKMQYVQNPLAGLKAVSVGESAGYIGNELHINYLINRHYLRDLDILPTTIRDLIRAENHTFAVNKNNELLKRILDKALLELSDNKLAELKKKWFDKYKALNNGITALSKEQRIWLAENSIFSMKKPDLGLPIAQFNNGGYQGIAADFVNYVEQSLLQSWPTELPDSSTKTTHTDLTIGFDSDDEFIENYDLSSPIMSMPIVFLGGEHSGYINDLTQVAGLKLGSYESATFMGELQQQFPNLLIKQYASLTQALLALEAGELDLLPCPLAQCMYLMDHIGTRKVKVIGNSELSQTVHFGVKKGQDDLLSIINTILSNMSPQHRNSIFRRWNSREDVLVKFDYTVVWYVIAFFILLIGLILFWNRKKAQYISSLEKAHSELSLTHKALQQTQNQLLQAEKMSSLGTLSAGIAHEINNPTNFVYGSAQNLESDLNNVLQFLRDLAGEDADEEVLEEFEKRFAPLFNHVGLIGDGATRIKTIVSDMSVFSRSDKEEMENTPIRRCIDTTVHLVQTKYKDSTNFEVNYSDEPSVMCFPSKINQVLMNLLVNASQAIAENKEHMGDDYFGEISITTYIENGNCMIAIGDNGKGIAEKDLRKIFEPFFTTKKVGEGTGLGLSLCYEVVQQHNGELKVQSSVGQGTLFVLRLPMTQSQ